MAEEDFKLSQQTERTDIDGTEYIHVITPGSSWKALLSNVFTKVSSYLGLKDTKDDTYSGRWGFVPMVGLDSSTDAGLVPEGNSLILTKLPTFQDIVSGNAILRGGIRFISGLTYEVWASSYIIDGFLYSDLISDEVTLSAGDPTDPRIDVFIVRVTLGVSSIEVLQGTPDPNPVKPVPEFSTEVEVSFKLIPANAAVDPDVVLEDIYDENLGEPAEWDNTELMAGASLADALDPYKGTVSLIAPATTISGIIGWTNDASIVFDNEATLIFAMKIPDLWGLSGSVSIRLINTSNSGTWVKTLTINNLLDFGYVVGSPVWQLVSIPFTDFQGVGVTGGQYDKIEFSFTKTREIHLDWIHIQSGISQPTDPAERDTFLEYIDIADMLSEQLSGNQSIQYLIQVNDASADTTNVPNGGVAWYRARNFITSPPSLSAYRFMTAPSNTGGGGGASNLQVTTDLGATTTNSITIGGGIAPLGILDVGTGGGSTSSNPIMNMKQRIISAVNAHGMSDNNIIEGSGNMAYASFDSRSKVESGTETLDHFNSFQASPTLNTSGLVDELVGVSVNPTINAGSSVNKRIGVFLKNPVGVGTINDNYGIIINNQTRGSKNWAILTGGGLVEFGNPTGLTTTIESLLLSRNSAAFGEYNLIRWKAGSTKGSAIGDNRVSSNKHDLVLLGSSGSGEGTKALGLTIKYNGKSWFGLTPPNGDAGDLVTVNGTLTVIDKTTGELFTSSSTNTEINAQGSDALITKDYADANYRPLPYIVSALPSGAVGDRAYVTDALNANPDYADIAVGGGVGVLPVFFNGTNWIYA